MKRTAAKSSQKATPSSTSAGGMITRAKSQLFSEPSSTEASQQTPKPSGLLVGLNPSDVSDSKLRDIISKASSPQDLFGVVSSAEMIDLIFLWFGAGNLDVDWYYDTGRGRQRSILPSPHNRAIQD